MKPLNLNTTSAAIIWLCLFLLSVCTIKAQNSTMRSSKQPFDYDQIFSTNYWNFFIRPAISFSSDAHFSNQAVSFEIDPSPVVTFGWVYQLNFKESWRMKCQRFSTEEGHDKTHQLLNRWGIQAGVSISLYWSDFNYSVPISYSGLPNYYGAPQKYQQDVVFDVPIYAVYKLPIYDKSNSWLAVFKFGIDIDICNQTNSNLAYADIGLDNKGNQITVFQYSQTSSFQGYTYAYTSFHLSGGFNYILPSKKMLNLQIVGNYSPFYSDLSSFSFMPGGSQEIDGKSSRHQNYIGVELNYIFTRVRHMTPARPGFRIPPIKEL